MSKIETSTYDESLADKVEFYLSAISEGSTNASRTSAVNNLRELESSLPTITSAQLRLVQRQFERNPNGLNWKRVKFFMYIWQQQIYKSRVGCGSDKS
jgi:hypothetical protein